MNPKIEKIKGEIVKARAKIAELQTRIKLLEKQKIDLENEEIVALYRRESLNEEQFKALLRSQRKTGAKACDTAVYNQNADNPAANESAINAAYNENADNPAKDKEDKHNAFNKN